MRLPTSHSPIQLSRQGLAQTQLVGVELAVALELGAAGLALHEAVLLGAPRARQLQLQLLDALLQLGPLAGLVGGLDLLQSLLRGGLGLRRSGHNVYTHASTDTLIMILRAWLGDRTLSFRFALCKESGHS